MIKFEWEPSKAAANLKKHHVSFEEAKSVFYDDLPFNSSMKITQQTKIGS